MWDNPSVSLFGERWNHLLQPLMHIFLDNSFGVERLRNSLIFGSSSKSSWLHLVQTIDFSSIFRYFLTANIILSYQLISVSDGVLDELSLEGTTMRNLVFLGMSELFQIGVSLYEIGDELVILLCLLQFPPTLLKHAL